MKTLHRLLHIGIFLAAVLSTSGAQVHFRSGIFLHHSTGGCIWGPNYGSVSVPDEITKYNTSHGYTEFDSISLDESSWPLTPWDNEWERWHRIFENRDTVDADIRPLLLTNKIIIIKSCFPSSSISGIGESTDTLSPENKTIYNYKWHWRTFIRVMEQHPENFFVVWTNAPLIGDATSDDAAQCSDLFCRWAKDTLAKGLDAEFGVFPKNVYIFDFFHKLAGTDGKLLMEYSRGDSHPNAAATEIVAPQFVGEVFDAAIAYESVEAGIQASTNHPNDFQLLQNYPNPFNPSTTIKFQISHTSFVFLKIYDLLGREIETLVNEEMRPGNYERVFEGSKLASGIYYYRLEVGEFGQTRKLVLLK